MINETKWAIDQAHSEIGFKVQHLMIANVKGTFKKFDANICTTGNDFTTAVIDVWIDASSVATGDPKPDEHLKSADFFDVAHHKQITFISNTIGKAGLDGYHELWGALTIKGITNHIKLNVQFGGLINDLSGKEKAQFAVTGKINRNDWRLIWNTPMETGGLIISEEVTISCTIELFAEKEQNLAMELEPALGNNETL